ncbi:hypothetical protein [Halostagnicola kamekurae]|uniref:MarR family protein n=1 Tax=Halostagnicola kamekurae TaxID=619731 RepID=A0A1I6RDU2_9EURY|nr:hypothetical protein [Halostagnicola kamekurae]SFS62750.1 hypothetical protein SAMN04488556_1720 [Halostagnicola kamekurae]
MSLPDNTDVDAVRSSLPPSANYVLEAVGDAGGSISREELIDRSYYCDRTVDRAISQLEDRNLVRRDRVDDDLRYVHVKTTEIS